MNVIEILKEHFAENMTPEVEKKIKDALDLSISEKVSVKTKEIEKKLEEDMQKEIDEKVKDIKEKLNTYIEMANEEIINENLSNIQSKTKIELAEKIISGVTTVLKENDMTIAIEQKDMIKVLEDEVEKLGKDLNEAIKEISESKKQSFEHEKAIVFLESTKDITDTQKEKLMDMLENVVVEDIDEFKEKLETGMSIITEKKEDKKKDDEILDESFKQKKSENEKHLDQYRPKWID